MIWVIESFEEPLSATPRAPLYDTQYYNFFDNEKLIFAYVVIITKAKTLSLRM